MPTNVEGAARRPVSRWVIYPILAAAVPAFALLVRSGDNENARRLIDIDDDGVMSSSEEKRAEDFLSGVPNEEVENSIQYSALRREIIKMREEREKPKKRYHYTELF